MSWLSKILGFSDEGGGLSHQYARSSGGPKRQLPEEDQLTHREARDLAVNGPRICGDLQTLFNSLKAANTLEGTPEGRAKDVTTYLAFQQIGTQVQTIRLRIEEGGKRGYEKLQEARALLTKLQTRGLGLDT